MKTINILKQVLLAISVILIFTQCDGLKADGTEGGGTEEEETALEKFLSYDQLGSYSSSGSIFLYSEENHQIGISTSPTYQFRIQTDSQSTYLFIEIDEVPSTLNDVVEVSVQSSGISSLSSVSTLSMTVSKSASDQIWLWDATEEIGLIIEQ